MWDTPITAFIAAVAKNVPQIVARDGVCANMQQKPPDPTNAEMGGFVLDAVICQRPWVCGLLPVQSVCFVVLAAENRNAIGRLRSENKQSFCALWFLMYMYFMIC